MIFGLMQHIAYFFYPKNNKNTKQKLKKNFVDLTLKEYLTFAKPLLSSKVIQNKAFCHLSVCNFNFILKPICGALPILLNEVLNIKKTTAN